MKKENTALYILRLALTLLLITGIMAGALGAGGPPPEAAHILQHAEVAVARLVGRFVVAI